MKILPGQGHTGSTLHVIPRTLCTIATPGLYKTNCVLICLSACSQVSQAGKRLSPTDPDRSRPKPPVLPWWDMMRFVWRGSIQITATYVHPLKHAFQSPLPEFLKPAGVVSLALLALPC